MFEIIRGYAGFFFPKRLGMLPTLAHAVFKRAILRRPHLRVTEIAVTFACNSKCIMCSCVNFCDPQKEKERLSPLEYAALGRTLDRLGCVSVNITGGEPLLRDDIEEIIAAINPKNKIVNLVTNGIKLTAASIARFKHLGIDSIIVSLESTSAGENDRIRGHAGHFNHVMKIINWTRQLQIRCGISLTLCDNNFKKIHELIRFAEEHKVFLCIAHGGSIGRWEGNESVQLSQDNARKVLEIMRSRLNMKVDFSANLSLRPGCPAIVEKIYVTPYGDVLPCTFNPVSFGNVRRQPLENIWKNMQVFRKEYLHGTTLCMRSYDSRYIREFLDPIRGMKLPLDINDHPAYKKGKD